MVPRFGEKKRDRYITDDEYTRLIEAASPTLRVIINMAYLTGQRIGDVLKIKQSDISPDGNTFIQEKTGKKLKEAMTPALEENIRAAWQLHGRITLSYLPGQINGKIRSHKGVRDLLLGYVDKAELDDIHLHDFRAKAITDAKSRAMTRRRWPVTLRKRRQYAVCAIRKFRWYAARSFNNNAEY